MVAVHARVRAGLAQAAGGGIRPCLALRNDESLLHAPACVSIGSTQSMHGERTQPLSHPNLKSSLYVGIASRMLKPDFLSQATKWCRGPSRQADFVEGRMREKTQRGSRGIEISRHGAAALIAKVVSQASELAAKLALLLALLQLKLQQLKQQLLRLNARHLSVTKGIMGNRA